MLTKIAAPRQKKKSPGGLDADEGAPEGVARRVIGVPADAAADSGAEFGTVVGVAAHEGYEHLAVVRLKAPQVQRRGSVSRPARWPDSTLDRCRHKFPRGFGVPSRLIGALVPEGPPEDEEADKTEDREGEPAGVVGDKRQ